MLSEARPRLQQQGPQAGFGLKVWCSTSMNGTLLAPPRNVKTASHAVVLVSLDHPTALTGFWQKLFARCSR